MAAISNTGWSYTPDWTNTKTLASWLQDHGLHYGFGPYFDPVNASILGMASNGMVVARPVECSESNLIPRLASGDDQFWFGTSIPAPAVPQFVVFSKGDKEWTDCTIKDFGNPDAKYQYASWDIWVYQHNLMPSLMATVDVRVKQSTKIYIARNRRRTDRVCTTLRIKSNWVRSIFLSLLNAKDRIHVWQSAP